MAQEEQGMSFHLVLSEQEQSHAVTGTQVATVQNAQIPLHPLASLFDRSLLCLHGLLGQVRERPRTQQPLRPAGSVLVLKQGAFSSACPSQLDTNKSPPATC